jgi:hypothetical protein
VEKRRQVTEEDILVTEAMIARSYGRLKQSVARAPSRAFSSAGETVRKHPVAAAAAAVGAGIALFGLFRLMTRQGAAREKDTGITERRSRPDMTREILSMIIPLVTPYITGYLKNYMATVFSGERD